MGLTVNFLEMYFWKIRYLCQKVEVLHDTEKLFPQSSKVLEIKKLMTYLTYDPFNNSGQICLKLDLVREREKKKITGGKLNYYFFIKYINKKISTLSISVSLIN